MMDKWVSKKDTAALKIFVLKSDIYFANDWTLEKANVEEIDHFKNGYVLTWAKTVSKIKYLRTYVFDLNSQFIRSHEQRFLSNTLLSQGPVEFKNKSILYITQRTSTAQPRMPMLPLCIGQHFAAGTN